MKKLIKSALIFVGGMTAGGYGVVNMVLKSETFTTAFKDAITKKTIKLLYGPESNQFKHKVSYWDCGVHPQRARHHYEYYGGLDDIIFESRKDADDAVDTMLDNVNKYGMVSVGDVYEIFGLSAPDYAASKYGWQSVEGAKVARVRDGYQIQLPKPTAIK